MPFDTLLQRKICIFVGAGFSKALFDLATQSALVQDFLSWDTRNNSRPHLSSNFHRLLTSIEDIELIASHYHNLAYSKQSGRNRELVREFLLFRVALATYLDDVLRTTAIARTTLASDLVHDFLVSRKYKSSDFFIVSTNYDSAFENILANLFGKNSFWYPGVSTQHRTDAIPVFKLHGSVNWMEDRGSIVKNGFGRNGKPIIIAMPSEMQLKPSSEKFGYFFARGDFKYTPIIVPFLFQKHAWLKEDNADWRQIFDSAWGLAEALMKQANRLFFWGYSLPSADYHMFSLLLQTLGRPDAHFEVVDKGDQKTNMIRLGELFHDRATIHRDGLSHYLKRQKHLNES